MSFRLGDKAVYPAYGVGVISGIESKLIAGEKQDFYILQLLSSGTRFLIPTDCSQKVGLRAVINEHEITCLKDIITSRKKVCLRNWNRRFREFNVKLRAKDLIQVAEVLRDLYELEQVKPLSPGEKVMMEKALNLISTEISACTNRTETDVQVEIRSWFAH